MEPGQARMAELFAQVRSWDVCAMHDLDGAARATGYAADELLPDREPGICRLVTQAPNGVQEWELQLAVSSMSLAESGGQAIDAGGVRMTQGPDSDDTRCAYDYPINSPGEGERPWGIEVSVFSIAGNKAPCDVAREYATAVAPRLADPPLRSAGRTTPALDITASDPCAVAAAMVPELAGGQQAGARLAVEDLEPYQCSITVDVPQGASTQRLRGSVAFTLEDASDVGSATFGGFPGARDQLGINCQARFAPFNTLLAGDPASAPSIPVVEVVGECDRIEAMATAAAGAITPAPKAEPGTDAVALGDLRPAPTAASAGSPFDPCTVVGGWQAYPADLQPASPRPAVPMDVRPQDPFKVGCTFNAGDLLSSLVWGLPTADGFSADPAERRGAAVGRQYGGKPGVEETSTNKASGEPTCYSAVQISQGIAAMVTTLPADPCRVNRAVLEQVAQKVP